MPRNPLLTETTAENMLTIITGPEYGHACMLHSWAGQSGCKTAPRTGANYYRIQYHTAKPKRTLFTIECNEKRWRVKANLYHLDQYRTQAEQTSETIRQAITGTRACTGCNSKCIGGSRFRLNGRTYLTCIGSGHFFENMTKEEWQELRNLLAAELEIIGS